MKEKTKRHLFHDSRLWWLLSRYVFFMLRLFYRSITIEGKEKIPVKGPLIFAPNHQNALMDPLAVLYASGMQIIFLARADIFRKPLLKAIFYWLKILPVYRIRDGRDQLARNDTSFDISVEVLENGRAVGIFPEATHSDKWQLLPLKKGVPRLAFMAEEKHGFELGVKIVPVGIFYSNYEFMGSVLHLKFGEPVSVQDFKSDYQENDRRAQIALRDAIGGAIRPLAVDISHKEDYDLYAGILGLLTHSFSRRIKMKGNGSMRRFHARKAIIASLDRLRQDDSLEMQYLREKFAAFEQIKKEYGLDHEAAAGPERSLGGLLLRIGLFLSGLPLFVFGALNHLPFYLLVKKICSGIADRQFHSSVKFVMALLGLPLYYFLIFSLSLWLLPGWLPAMVYILLLPPLGLFARYYAGRFRRWLHDWRMEDFRRSQPMAYRNLADIRAEIVSRVENLINL